jgi:hypothetical protein
MPSDPVLDMLDRDFSRAAAKETIDIAGPMLREIVNFATRAFVRCDTSCLEMGKERVALIALYLHIIEMVDGVEVLVSAADAGPAVPLLRSAFEAVWSLEYILQDDCTRRSLSWLVSYYYDRLEAHERLDSTTDRGRQFRRSTEASIASLSPVDPSRVQPAIAGLRKQIDHPEYDEVKQEIKRHKGRPNHWYRLFDGPATLELLAMRIRRGTEYQIMYRHWSAEIHAVSLQRFLERSMAKDPLSRLLRNPGDVPWVATYGAECLLRATWLMLDKFRPGERADLFSPWIAKEVQTQLHKLSDGINVPGARGIRRGRPGA